MSVSADDDRFDIGDTIGGTDGATGVTATARITSKVLTVDAYGYATVTYGTD